MPMRPDRKALARASLWILLAVLPFGEGGAVPSALLLTHSLLLLSTLILMVPAGAGVIAPSLPRSLAPAGGLFILVLLVASIGSPYPYASFLRLLDFGAALLALALSHGLGGTARQNGRLADWVLGMVVLQSILMIGGRLSGDPAGALRNLGLLNSNHEAAYLNMGILLALPRLLAISETGWAIRGGGVVLVLAASALMASRGGAAGLVAGLVVSGIGELRSVPPVRRRRWLGIAAAGLLLLGAGLVQRFRVDDDPFRYRRIEIWSAVTRGAADAVWLGVGPGIYRYVAPRDNFPLSGPVRYGRSFQSAHSDYLGLLRETGVLGLGAGLFLIAAVAKAIRRRARKGSDPLTRGLPGIATALAVQGLFEDLSLRPALLITFAVLLGAALSPPVPARPRVEPIGRRRMLAFAATLAILLAWISAVWRPYRAYRQDQAMRHASTLRDMEYHFRHARRLNPYQAPTLRFPASAFLSSRAEIPLTPELYAWFRDDLDLATRIDRTSPEGFLMKGRLEVRAFRRFRRDSAIRDRAVAAYRQASRLAPHDPRVAVELARFLREAGETAQALGEVDRALVQEPAYQLAWLLRVRLLLDAGEAAAAREAWIRAESNRAGLVNYRPDSSYAEDITRDHDDLRRELAERIPPA